LQRDIKKYLARDTFLAFIANADDLDRMLDYSSRLVIFKESLIKFNEQLAINQVIIELSYNCVFFKKRDVYDRTYYFQLDIIIIRNYEQQ